MSMGSLSGLAIALAIHSLDRSLFAPIIYVLAKLRETVLICGKLIFKAAWLIRSAHCRHQGTAADGVDWAHDGKKFSGAGYSDAVKIRAHFFDKL